MTTDFPRGTTASPDAPQPEITWGSLYDTLADLYDSSYTDPIHKAEDIVTARLIRRVMRKCGPSPAILDVGCGTGWMLDHVNLSDSTCYWGTDISSPMVALAQHKHPDPSYMAGYLPRLRFDCEDAKEVMLRSKASFDLVFSTYGSMSYAPITRWVDPLRHCLRIGGRFLISVLTSKSMARESSLASEHPEVIFSAHQAGLRSAFKDGFDRVSITGLNHLGDAWPRWPPKMLAGILEAYRVTLGRVIPDSCHLIVVTGRRAPRRMRRA